MILRGSFICFGCNIQNGESILSSINSPRYKEGKYKRDHFIFTASPPSVTLCNMSYISVIFVVLFAIAKVFCAI